MYALLAQEMSCVEAFLDGRAIPAERWMGGTFACAVAQHLLDGHGWSEPATVARALRDGRAAPVLGDGAALAEVAATRTMQVCDPWFGALSARIRTQLLGEDEHDLVDLGCGAGIGLVADAGSLTVARRIGIDLHLPTLDPASVRWLRSCLPVDHVHRREALSVACAAASTYPGLVLVEGDVLDRAEALLRTCGSPRTVVQASGLLHALGPVGQRRLADLLARHMEERAGEGHVGAVIVVDPDGAAILALLRLWSIKPPPPVLTAGRDVLRRLAVVVSWSGGPPTLQMAAVIERDRPEGATIFLGDEDRRR